MMIGSNRQGALAAHARTGAGALLAIVQAPDKKSYTLRPGDPLLDGAVKVVAKDAVIFVQRVDDPLSPVKQREIRKTLRTPEENR